MAPLPSFEQVYADCHRHVHALCVNLLGNSADAQDGQLLVRSGATGRARVLVSSSVTAEALTNALTGANGSSPRQREDIEQLQLALSRFTANRYNRAADIDGVALDESLDRTTQLSRRLAARHGWLKPLRGSRLWAD